MDYDQDGTLVVIGFNVGILTDDFQTFGTQVEDSLCATVGQEPFSTLRHCVQCKDAHITRVECREERRAGF